MKFNEKLLELRKQKCLSQEELSYKLNVARQTISKWESGTTTPDFDNLIKLSKIFEISIDEFVGNDFIKITEEKEDVKEAKENSQKQKMNKAIKIIWSLIFFILFIFAIIFCVKVIERYKVVDEVSKRLITSYNYGENPIDEYMFTKDISIFENRLVTKMMGEKAYRKGDVFRKDYYDTDVSLNKQEVSAYTVRIEYRDKEFYYDIDMINKTYKKEKYEKGVESFYYFAAIELDSEIIDTYNFNAFGLENIKNKLLIASDFNNTIKYDDEQIDERNKSYTINNYNERNTKKNAISVYVNESKKEPYIAFSKTKGKEKSQMDYEIYNYVWRAKEVTDEEIALPDLSEFTLIE